MSTIPCPPSCRSCAFYLSNAEAHAAGLGGICYNDQSPAAFETVRLSDSCREHKARVIEGLILTERECMRCEHVNIYALGFGGTSWCANPACPDNQEA